MRFVREVSDEEGRAHAVFFARFADARQFTQGRVMENTVQARLASVHMINRESSERKDRAPRTPVDRSGAYNVSDVQEDPIRNAGFWDPRND